MDYDYVIQKLIMHVKKCFQIMYPEANYKFEKRLLDYVI